MRKQPAKKDNPKKANLNKAFVAESESESEAKPAKKSQVKPP